MLSQSALVLLSPAHPSITLSISLSIFLSRSSSCICPSLRLSIHLLSFCPSFHRNVRFRPFRSSLDPSIFQSLSIHSLHPSVHLSVHRYVRLFIRILVSIYLSVHTFFHVPSYLTLFIISLFLFSFRFISLSMSPWSSLSIIHLPVSRFSSPRCPSNPLSLHPSVHTLCVSLFIFPWYVHFSFHLSTSFIKLSIQMHFIPVPEQLRPAVYKVLISQSVSPSFSIPIHFICNLMDPAFHQFIYLMSITISAILSIYLSIS